jgi:hypothetical protein
MPHFNQIWQEVWDEIRDFSPIVPGGGTYMTHFNQIFREVK